MTRFLNIKAKQHFLNDSVKIKVHPFNCEDCPPIVEIRDDGKIVDAIDKLTYNGLRKKNGLILNNTHFKIINYR